MVNMLTIDNFESLYYLNYQLILFCYFIVLIGYNVFCILHFKSLTSAVNKRLFLNAFNG